MLQKYENIENIYKNLSEWKVNFKGGVRHSNTIYEKYELLKLFKNLTTLRSDVKVPRSIKDYSLSDINISDLSKFSDKY